VLSAFFTNNGPAKGSSHWHFIWSPSLFCGWTTNLEWFTTWATRGQHTSVFQVSLEDILLPPSHGQLAPHSQVTPPIAFLWRSLSTLYKKKLWLILMIPFHTYSQPCLMDGLQDNLGLHIITLMHRAGVGLEGPSRFPPPTLGCSQFDSVQPVTCRILMNLEITPTFQLYH